MSDETRLRLLVLRGRSSKSEAFIKRLTRKHEVIQAESFGQALGLMRAGNFDAVISETADFLPLERSSGIQQASTILNTLSEGICTVDRQGRLLWSNKRMWLWPKEVTEKICQYSREAYEHFREQEAKSGSEKQVKWGVRKFSLSTAGNRFFQVVVSPLRTQEKHLAQVVAVSWEESQARRLQQGLDAIDRAGQELVRLDVERMADMNMQQRLDLLEDKILRFTENLLPFQCVSIRLLDRKTNKLELVICGGKKNLSAEAELLASAEGSGICGYVAATGRSYICYDVSQDERYLPGLEDAKSSLTVPLRLRDEVIGTFNVESDQVGAFGENHRQLAEIFAQYVAIALHILDLLIVERYKASGQLANSVAADIAEPLDDILREATALKEEYIGQDDMLRRIQSIADNAQAIRKSTSDVSKQRSGLLNGAQIKTKQDKRLKDKKILVVDDEPMIRQTIGDLLRRFGCSVDSVAEGNKAVEMINKNDYDLILSDIKMPGKNGYEIFAAAKNKNQDLPVILMTGFGYDPNHSIVRARKEGLAAVLFKPFKVDQLLGEIRKAVGMAT
ncbi:MAG: response regulator [Actinobacteria bacterium]|nr:response regulator [Actinomycetota bacterium]